MTGRVDPLRAIAAQERAATKQQPMSTETHVLLRELVHVLAGMLGVRPGERR